MLDTCGHLRGTTCRISALVRSLLSLPLRLLSIFVIVPAGIRSMQFNALMLFACGVALTLSFSEASAQQQFNGRWSVEVIPQRGFCNKGLSFPVVIQNGQVRYAGAEGIGVTGAVTRRGVIQGSVGIGPI